VLLKKLEGHLHLNKTILILGAAGFIGTHLVNALKLNSQYKLVLAGYGVEKFYGIKDSVLLPGEITPMVLDCIDTPDVIFNMAGGASVGLSIQNPLDDFEKTVPLISNVLNKMRLDWQGCKLIYLSSAAVYGKSASASTSVNEVLDPVSPYGLHKKIAEELILFYTKQYNLRTNIVRPFSVYGPGLDKQLLWDALVKIKCGNNHFYGTGKELRDWIYVHDLIQLLISIIEEEQYPSIINAGTGVATSVEDILSLLFLHHGVEAKPQFSDGTKIGDPNHLVSCYDEQSSYSPLYRTNLDSGIAKFVEWFKEYYK